MKRHERSSGGVFRPPESEARGHLAAWKPRTCCWDARLWRSRPGLSPSEGLVPGLGPSLPRPQLQAAVLTLAGPQRSQAR